MTAKPNHFIKIVIKLILSQKIQAKIVMALTYVVIAYCFMRTGGVDKWPTKLYLI